MDEPTNHLDLESSEALAAALETFGGTLVFVSHNRSFVHRLATRVWDVKDGGVEEFPGTFTEYLDRCARLDRTGDADSEAAIRSTPDGARRTGPSADGDGRDTAQGATPVAARKQRAGSRRRNAGDQRARRGLERKVKELEERIAGIEAAQAERSSVLSKPETYADTEKYNELLGAYRDDAAKLEELMGRWETLSAELAAASDVAEPG